MNGSVVQKLTERLGRFPNLLLASHLFILHLIAFGGWRLFAPVRLLWPVAVGLLLLWQPFVDGEQRVSRRQVVALLALVAATTLVLNPWLLLIWCGALAAVIGGRVLWTVRRLERIGYLAAFGYLLCLIILGVVPEVAAGKALLEPLSRDAVDRYLPLGLPLLLAFPARQPQRRTGDSFDFFYGVMLFLFLAVFVLGSLAYMLIGGVDYIESVLQTSFALAGALLVLAWVWNPRSGFSGISSAFTRHVLSLGMPLQQWLELLNEESEREADPERFLAAAMKQLLRLPWVTGGRWAADRASGEVGALTDFVHAYQRGDLVQMALYFRQQPSPAMHWHIDWLLRLAAEFYVVKRQTRELQRVSYQQAVYETGARVTHDVKNLLQSLQTLCYAASQPGEPAALAQLFSRQLPQIAERLKSTLDKLQRRPDGTDDWVSVAYWWEGLRERYAGSAIVWGEAGPPPGCQVPRGLFDSVAENLLQNALAKRRREEGIAVRAECAASGGGVLFRVHDSGTPLPMELAEKLMREPVASEDGLGIGLYHAGRQAAEMGYRLALEENDAGGVSFILSPQS